MNLYNYYVSNANMGVMAPKTGVLMLGIAMVMFVTPWGSRCETERLIDCIYNVGNLYL